ncbi:hypothetical protein EJ02DRAFT_425221 [Clathrospora elynae]|uniref:Uncharacterized protein n=1 Tax=Clathrospora elynae TaxID=706981 RepID=A0A6A5SH01_9PLEO|nr:hypothetical protein EJ02DRAFT_425221 [Clathrospora elynae]
MTPLESYSVKTTSNPDPTKIYVLHAKHPFIGGRVTALFVQDYVNDRLQWFLLGNEGVNATLTTFPRAITGGETTNINLHIRLRTYEKQDRDRYEVLWEDVSHGFWYSVDMPVGMEQHLAETLSMDQATPSEHEWVLGEPDERNVESDDRAVPNPTPPYLKPSTIHIAKGLPNNHAAYKHPIPGSLHSNALLDFGYITAVSSTHGFRAPEQLSSMFPHSPARTNVFYIGINVWCLTYRSASGVDLQTHDINTFLDTAAQRYDYGEGYSMRLDELVR